ncbi:hypothetical protein C0992_009829 [Termitomyces sp. T32_za158]|nr:hypothetical protein C0992_009829 [Termitomyces sp. T32_za158]
MGSPVSWWAGMEGQAEEHRPWRDPPKRKNTVPEEQSEGWVHARERVGQAVKSVLGTATDVAHEILFTGMPVLNSVPVPGLGAAAYILLEIWDALQLVDRCADILLSVREKVKEAGDQVHEKLQVPIAKLTESFYAIQSFLLKQVHRPFLKRYLKRDDSEIQAQIRTCHAGLTEALGMLGLSIQIRTLKSVQGAERGRREDQRVLMEILRGGAEGEGIGLGLTRMEMPAMGTRWSFGGVIAYEVAQHLELLGRTAQGILLIDAPNPIGHVTLSDSVVDAVLHLDGRSINSKVGRLKGSMRFMFKYLLGYRIVPGPKQRQSGGRG